ncbi:SDR family oxidoreductase [Nonomuraea sp. SMC257]|uniref:SDR family oxidoreductase n=2 Tax=Nonomuraea montanisoli TaxID=2741721 RepID=A0A7Y6I6U2_9ACTN|nr:SDR family oxidoreductase [Nonomuraea montanisoli]
MTMTILITGATGTVSSAVLDALPGKDGVRVLVRDPAKAPTGYEVAVGDLDDPATLTDAFDGVETLWLLTAMGPQAPHASMNAVWAARQAGVRHVVRMSAIGAAHDAPTRNGRLHALSDTELQASGLGWTVIRPAFFMQNLFGSVSGDTLYGGTGQGRLGLIDVRDIGEFAATVLTDPRPHTGKVYTLTGPASISLGEAAEQLAEVYGRSIAYHSLEPEQAYAGMKEAGVPEWIAAVTAEYLRAYAKGWGDYTTKDYASVTGKQPTPFADFARAHANQLLGQA